MNVGELMTKGVKACSMNDTLEVAARIMWENDCGIVPIVEPSGRVIAMVTDRDICMAGFTQGMQYWQIPVAVAASKSVFSVNPTDSLQTAEDMMRSRQVRRLAVVDDDGKLLGILSLNDLALHTGHRAEDLPVDELVRTISGICAHRPAA